MVILSVRHQHEQTNMANSGISDACHNEDAGVFVYTTAEISGLISKSLFVTNR